MMYIEHFVLLAGAYNLGFFIELAEYFIFYFLFFALQVQRRETAMNHTPVYTFGLGYPLKTKYKLFTIQNSTHNEEN